jgi:hypothetical protein
VGKYYEFIQTPVFSARLDATGETELLGSIESEIARNPQGGSLLRGGIRKIRVASSGRAGGKSGGFRIWFFHQVDDRIYLIFLIDKRKAPNLTPAQEKLLIYELARILDEVTKGGN